ncbi:UNVERIFIED_CONTAM: Floral homeotic protein DEFICIENS [Sesamum latifolium]|uniref:Floral homeotic protein DEFICIENS n=1 Tax=Sesamum latifolium TaxID=2727402 RepID=A0AAW2W9S7_9LAMI
MARGKIQIKKIENQTNRQVTYSKRRNGLFKKAHELTVLCDARVSIIMISSTQKLHEYISPSTTTKQVFDQYQNAVGVDLWSSHYEKMQEHLKKLKDVNRNLRRRLVQSHRQPDRNQQEELRNVEEIHRNLVLELDARQEDPHYGLVEHDGDYNSVLGFPHGPRIIALRLPPNHHHHHPGLHGGGAASDLTTFALLD